MNRIRTTIACLALSAACSLVMITGCGDAKAKDRGFATSGNKDADQRADQRMAKDQQLKDGSPGSAGGTGDAKPAANGAQVEKQKTLYERLGGESGLNALADDFLNRVINDPTVNWERKGLEQGGFSIHRNRSIEWPSDQAHRDVLKKHLVQFLSLKTGGPVTYEGKEMKAAHEGMRITSTEFQASIGDLKQALDKLQIATQEQKELLQIVEATQDQVVTER